MAAGHLHHDKFNGHQRAEEVAVPKLADPNEGRSEPSAKNWRRATSESRYHVDCLGRHEERNERPMETEKSRTNENPYLGDCPMIMSNQHHQEQRRPLAQTRQEP